MLEAIFFDYDGTISPTSRRQEKWFKHYSTVHNKKWRFTNFEEFLLQYNEELNQDGGVQNFYDLLNLPCDMKDKEHPVWAAYHKFVAEHPTGLYRGMKKTIKEIFELGKLDSDPSRNCRLRIGINTTNTWKNCNKELEKNNLLQYFDSFITEEVLNMYHGANDGDAIKKPSKISIALMLDLLGSRGEQTLHIGDTLNDLVASNKVIRLNPKNPETLITVGACYGYESRAVLEGGVVGRNDERIHFDYLIDKPTELITIVTELL